MKHPQRPLVRLAVAIHAAVHDGLREDPVKHFPEHAWRRCCRLQRQLNIAIQRGWRLSAVRLTRELRFALNQLADESGRLARMLDAYSNPRLHSSMHDVYQDLVALDREFDGLKYDLGGKTVSVTTEPITLDDIYLGPFEIQLDWTKLGRGHSRSFQVIALDPHPAASNENVTHPHCQDCIVCEGDGHSAIGLSLEQGRLLDFFSLVANLLRTYNPDSPYVRLRDWYGVECSDCGGSADEDDHWTCEECQAVICCECYCLCRGCDKPFCGQCVQRCGACDQDFCNSCLVRCNQCETSTCNECLCEDERCVICHERELEETDIPVQQSA